MSFLFKGKKSKSGSPKIAKKSDARDGRAKSQPSQSLHSLGATSKSSSSYSTTKSHDPDLSSGLSSKLSALSLEGSSDEEFHDALESEDDPVLDGEEERSYTPKAYTKTKEPLVTKSAPAKKKSKTFLSRNKSPGEEIESSPVYSKSQPTPKKTQSPAKKELRGKKVLSKAQMGSDDSDEESRERSYSPQAYSKSQSLLSKSKSASPAKTSSVSKKSASPLTSKAAEPSPSYYGKENTKKSSPPYGQTKQAAQPPPPPPPPSYDQTLQDNPSPPAPPLFSKAKATKSTPSRLHQEVPQGLPQKISKTSAASYFQKGDTVDLPPSYSNASSAPYEIEIDMPPPSYTQAVVGDQGDKATTNTSTLSSDLGASKPPPPPPLPPGEVPDAPSATSTNKTPPPPPPPPPQELSDTSSATSKKASKYPTETAATFESLYHPILECGIATDQHFQIVAEELSPNDLPGLCRHIGLTTTKVEQIQYDNRHLPFQEQVIAILQEWRKKAGRDVTLKALLQALANSGNVMVANIIEDRLQIKGYVQHEVKESCSTKTDKVVGTSMDRLDKDGKEKFKLTMSELKSAQVQDKESVPTDHAGKLKYFCPKCNQGYANVTLLHLHVDQCIDHVATRNKLKMQTSIEAVDELDAPMSSSTSNISSTIINENTLRKLASQLGRDWKKLAVHLGFSHRAIHRLESRHPNYTSQEKALYMLKDWVTRQDAGYDVVGTIAKNLHKCGERHLVELAEWLRKQETTPAASTGPKTELPSGLLSPETPQGKSFKDALMPLRTSNISSTIDDDTLRKLASQLGKDWKKLAAHLGFSQQAINKQRQPHYNVQEKAFYMLKDWIRRQDAGSDVVGTIANNLHKCGEKHLVELAEWLRTPAAAIGQKTELPSGLLSPETPQGMSSDGSHIMISYQWDSQTRALELKQQLSKAGYSVWMDVDKMGGDLLGSMADAVENAAVVILCVSQKYKDSNNCRGEASYAFQLKKPIIPVIVEKDYQPDGWLGMVISMRLYYRMYNDEVMKDDLPALLNDIGDKGRTYQHSVSFSAKATSSPIDSYDLMNKCKAYVYLCDPEYELLPYADVWVTMFINPSLRIFKDEVSQQVLKQGGTALHKSLKALFGTNATPLKVGTVLQSTPGDLPCQKAFHIIYKESSHSSGYVAELHSAFAECLWLAEHRGAASVAFSLFTNQELSEFNSVVEELVDSVMMKLKENVKGSCLKKVMFVTQKTSLTKKISGKLYNTVSVEKAPNNRRGVRLYAKTKLHNDTTISVLNGNLLEATTDAIIVSIASSLQRVGICAAAYMSADKLYQPKEKFHGKITLKNGTLIRLCKGNMKVVSMDAIIIPVVDTFRRYGICQVIYKAGGKVLQAEFSEYAKKNQHRQLSGQAFKVDSGDLPCGRVIYAVVPSSDVPKNKNKEDLLGESLLSSLKIAEQDGFGTVAVPLIGANYMNFPSEKAASILVDVVLQYFMDNPSSSIKEFSFIDSQDRCVSKIKEVLGRRVGAENIQGGDSPDGDENEMETESVTEIEIEETPAEILARGPAAHQAYLEASRDGTKPVYRTRLMLVGQERVGKTSLMKNLSGQRFDATETITDGVDASTLCEIPGDISKPWEIQDSAVKDLANYVQSQYMDALCTLMAQRLTELSEREQHVDSADEAQEQEELMELLSQMKELQVKEEPSEEVPESDAAPVDYDLEVDSTPMSEEESSLEGDKGDHDMVEVDAEMVQDSEPEEVKPDVPDAILQKLKQVLREKKLELQEAKNGVQHFQIWDFAGQDVYYTTHQVFLSNRALYMVIFDLRSDLNKPVKVEVFHNDKVQSRFHDFTGFGFLDFWMQSIYAYATSNKPVPDEDRPQLSPPIFIIGTHRGSNDISPDPEERKHIVNDKFQSIADMIAGKPYEQHVVSRYYAIENSSNDQTDEELTQLRHQLVSIASQESYMGERIPLRWLTFEKSVAEAITKGLHYMTLSQVQELTSDLGVADDTELFTMLHFYHDLGTIIFFGGDDCTDSYLQDMVILDPQWLIDVFKRIITVMPHQKQWATQKNKWRRLKEEGIIEDSLIDHMWQSLLPQKPALIALMEMFDLLCPRLDAQEGADTYYVPACLQPCSEEEVRQDTEASCKPVSFYIDFRGFLPDGLFHRLLVHAARWSQQQSGEEPQLYFRYGNFTLDDEHNFQLEMKGADQVCIKVTICKVLVFSPDGVHDKSNVDVEPSPKACSVIHTFLNHALNELTFTWIRGIKYQFSVACPCNDLQQATSDPGCNLHLLLLEDCLVKAKIKCKGKKMWVATDVFKKWFHKKEEQDEIGLLKQANKSLSDVELLEIAGEVGSTWKKLGLYLGLRACHIASLNRDHPMTEDKAFNMLIKWHEGLAEQNNARVLLNKALKKCGLVSLAESYENPKDVQ